MLGPAYRAPDLFILGRRLLEHTITTLRDQGRPVPARRYVADGAANAVAIDTEQLVVAWGQVTGLIPTAGQTAKGTVNWQASMAVQLARRAPSHHAEGGEWFVPTPEEIETSAKGLLADVIALTVVGSTFREHCGIEPIGPAVNVVGPEGGMAEAVLTFGLRLL